MNQTEDIKDLVAALSKAQGKMEPAKFNRINPHFKSRYADMASCMDACRDHLATNGLSILQYCETIEGELTLVTMLAHVSGQWIKSHFPLNPKDKTSQAIGSAMTYAKRYSLSSLLGIVSEEEDDDGEASQGRAPKAASKPAEEDTAGRIRAQIIAQVNKMDEDKVKEFRGYLTEAKVIVNTEKDPARLMEVLKKAKELTGGAHEQQAA